MQHHNYSLSDLDNMIPWESEIYLALLHEYVKEENAKQKEQNKQKNAQIASGNPRNLT